MLMQEGLVAKEETREGIRDLTLPADVYFGVGLCNGSDHPQITRGLPIDVLSMILLAERLGAEKRALIADTHALTNGFSHSEIDAAAEKARATLAKTAANLGLERWSVLRASEIDEEQQYLMFLSEAPGENGYFRRELADMAWFASRGTTLKIGWALNGSRNTSETSFDARFREWRGGLGFAYVVPGVSLDPAKPRLAPYFCPDPARRIMLEPGEDVRAKLASADAEQANACRNYLRALVRLYDKALGVHERGPTEERAQGIIERCTR